MTSRDSSVRQRHGTLALLAPVSVGCQRPAWLTLALPCILAFFLASLLAFGFVPKRPPPVRAGWLLGDGVPPARRFFGGPLLLLALLLAGGGIWRAVARAREGLSRKSGSVAPRSWWWGSYCWRGEAGGYWVDVRGESKVRKSHRYNNKYRNNNR